MALSRRAKVRIKAMTAAERKQLKAAARVLYNSELMGPKRYSEIERFIKRQ